MDALVRQYERPVYNVALRMTGNRSDAEDVTQTTFLKAFQNLGQFNPAYRLFSWIYRIAMNESINFIKGRRPTQPLDETRPSTAPGPEMLADADRYSRELMRAMEGLSADYRSVLTLKYFLDCRYQEIAEILSLPEKTVKSRLYSARRLLKEALERDGVRF